MASGRYEITKDAVGEFRFSLVTVSGKVLVHSAPYKTLGVCKKGIASLRVNSDAPLEDKCESFEGMPEKELKCPKFELSEQKGGGYNFVLKAKNGNIIARGEGYGTKMRCLEAISNLRYIAFSSETVLKF